MLKEDLDSCGASGRCTNGPYLVKDASYDEGTVGYRCCEVDEKEKEPVQYVRPQRILQRIMNETTNKWNRNKEWFMKKNLTKEEFHKFFKSLKNKNNISLNLFKGKMMPNNTNTNMIKERVSNIEDDQNSTDQMKAMFPDFPNVNWTQLLGDDTQSAREKYDEFLSQLDSQKEQLPQTGGYIFNMLKNMLAKYHVTSEDVRNMVGEICAFSETVTNAELISCYKSLHKDIKQEIAETTDETVKRVEENFEEYMTEVIENGSTLNWEEMKDTIFGSGDKEDQVQKETAEENVELNYANQDLNGNDSETNIEEQTKEEENGTNVQEGEEHQEEENTDEEDTVESEETMIRSAMEGSKTWFDKVLGNMFG